MAKEKRPWLGFRGRGSVLSGPELLFYEALKEAVGDEFVILLKVGLLDLCEIAHREVDRKRVEQLATQNADFALCDRTTLAPVVAIELDDAKIYGRERAEREAVVDEFFRVIGVTLIRQRVQTAYDPAGIGRWVRAAASRSRPPLPSAPLRPAS
jgi:hypothetical protein